MNWYLIVILIPYITATVPKCCQNENIISKRKCIDGSNITSLSCSSRFITNSTKHSYIDNEDNLNIYETKVSPDRYCITHFNGSNNDIYLICFEDDINESGYKYIINGILMLISSMFILLTISIYCQLPDLLDLQGICILHSIIGLGLTFFFLGLSQFSIFPNGLLCLFDAYVIYFCSLYTFFWLNTLSFHIWKTTINPTILSFTKFWYLIYHVFAIGGPIILLSLLITVHHSTDFVSETMHPGLGEITCWFKSSKVEFVYFYGPVSILLCINVVYYGWTIIVLWKDLTKCDEKTSKLYKYRLILCIKLFFVMGISWIFEVLSALIQNYNFLIKIIWFLTDTINMLQGILIFLILVVFRKRVVRNLADRTFLGKRLPSNWRTAQDDECEEIEEELGLDIVHNKIPPNS